MILRLAHADDIEAIVAIDQAVLKTNWHEKLYLESMVLKDTSFWVLEHEGQCIGFNLYRDIGGDFEILQIALDPQYHQQGLGSLLMDHMLEKASHQKVKAIFLEVHEANTSALQFYTKFGFHKIHIRKNYYGPQEDGIVMKKEF